MTYVFIGKKNEMFNCGWIANLIRLPYICSISIPPIIPLSSPISLLHDWIRICRTSPLPKIRLFNATAKCDLNTNLLARASYKLCYISMYILEWIAVVIFILSYFSTQPYYL